MSPALQELEAAIARAEAQLSAEDLPSAAGLFEAARLRMAQAVARQASRAVIEAKPYSVSELAASAGCSARYIQKLIACGALPAGRVGRRFSIAHADAVRVVRTIRDTDAHSANHDTQTLDSAAARRDDRGVKGRRSITSGAGTRAISSRVPAPAADVRR